MLLLPPLPRAAEVFQPSERVPLHHRAHGVREFDGDVSGVGVWAWLIRKLRELQIGQLHPRGRAAGAQEKSRHSDDGRRADRAFHRRAGSALAICRTRLFCWRSFALIAFAAIGFIDDYAKVASAGTWTDGEEKTDLAVQCQLCRSVTLLVLSTHSAYSTQLIIPFLKRFRPDLVFHICSIRELSGVRTTGNHVHRAGINAEFDERSRSAVKHQVRPGSVSETG